MKKVYCATKGIIVKDGKILALKQRHDGKEYLDLPGGRVDFGFSPEENMIKEAKEEVDLDIKIESLVGIYHFFRFVDEDQVVCIVYLCKPLTEKIDLSKNPVEEENITEYKWVTPEEFVKLESDYFKGLENMKKVVKDHFKN